MYSKVELCHQFLIGAFYIGKTRQIFIKNDSLPPHHALVGEMQACTTESNPPCALPEVEFSVVFPVLSALELATRFGFLQPGNAHTNVASFRTWSGGAWLNDVAWLKNASKFPVAGRWMVFPIVSPTGILT